MTEPSVDLVEQDLLDQLGTLSLPTLGHFLEDGFCSPMIATVVPGSRMLGVASTALIPDADAIAVNQALVRLRRGEVLVLDMGGDTIHAPVGAVTAAAARSKGAAGIVVNGPVTDVAELREPAEDGSVLPVFSQGSTCLTTKRHNSGRGVFGVPITIGGATVHPGDLIMGDDNGVVVLSKATAAAVLDKAQASDLAEPAILGRIASGEPLENILALG
ncbi:MULTISPECIES: RraA family protein [Arthrobacter]|uniref:RraA family protein n=1 Tax=Arthrobacter TaxID=1663 RepID=UPI000A77A474|nr:MULTISPECIES: RraA family protein [Arthrobacter]